VRWRGNRWPKTAAASQSRSLAASTTCRTAAWLGRRNGTKRIASTGHSRNPVVLLTRWGLWVEVEVHRAVTVAVHFLVVGIEAHARHIADETAGLQVVKRYGPELFRGDTGGHRQPVGVLTTQFRTLPVNVCCEIKSRCSELCCRRVETEETDSASVHVEIVGGTPFESGLRVAGRYGHKPFSVGPELRTIRQQRLHKPCMRCLSSRLPRCLVVWFIQPEGFDQKTMSLFFAPASRRDAGCCAS
jgi:hypothetical protein